jgi:hypothetical protein
MTQIDQGTLAKEMRPIREIGAHSNTENTTQFNCSLSVGAEGVCTIQVREWENNVARKIPITFWVSATALGVPGLGSASEVAVSNCTLLKELTTDSFQMIVTGATGLATVTITSAATETLYLNVILPDGSISYIDVAFAA